MSSKSDPLVLFFKALSNEDRLEIVRLLKKKKEMKANEVEECFYLEQSTTSHHLNTLKKAGIAKSRKEGRHRLYSLDIPSIQALLKKANDLIS